MQPNAATYNNSAYAPRKAIRWGIILTSLLLVGIASVWIAGRGRLSLKLPDTSATYTVQIIRQSDGTVVSTETIKQVDWNKLLAAGDYEVRVFTENARASSYFVTVPGFLGTTAKEVKLQNQADRTKLARGVASCPVYSSAELFSHECGWSNTLTRHVPLAAQSYSSQQDIQIEGIIASAPYQDGILALRLDGMAPVVSYIKSGQLITSKNLDTLGGGEGAIYQLAVDRGNGTAFAILQTTDRISAVYLADLDATPVTLSPKISDAPHTVASSIDLYDGRLMLAIGESSQPLHEDTASATSNRPANTHFYMYIKPTTDQLSENYQLAQPFSSARLCGSNHICILRDELLEVMSYAEQKLAAEARLHNVEVFTPVKNTSVVYLQDNKLFNLSVKDLSATLAFAADNFSVASVSTAGSSVLITATQDQARDSLLHAFLVSLTPSASNEFVDNKLPYPKGRFPELWDMDYGNRRILISLLLTSAVLDNTTGTVTYDQAEYNSVTQKIREQLQTDGINTSKYPVSFQVIY